METKQKSPLTQEQIDNALQVLVTAGIAGQSPTRESSPRIDRKMKAWRKQQEKNKALISECEEASDVLYQSLLKVLTTDHQRDLLNTYSVLVLAPWLVREETYKLFQSYLRRAKGKHLKKPASKRARGKS